MKKGAMFGLDARIALAIFGALSVIGSAALYSAIESAKVQQLLQTFKNIDAAYAQLYLDTSDPGVGINYLQKAIIPVSGWDGPYLSNIIDSGSWFESYIVLSTYPNIPFYLMAATDEGWTLQSPGFCDGSTRCYIWLDMFDETGLYLDELTRMFKKLDKIVDNSDGPSLGNIRFLYDDPIVGLEYKTSIPYKP